MIDLQAPAFSELDGFSGQIPVAVLARWLRGLELSFDDVREYLRFHPQRYVRNLLHDGPAYRALLLCWRNGQRSPIHDHQGSNCGVRVLQGSVIETTFDRAPNGMVYPVGSRQLHEGHIVASHDNDLHQMSNLQAGGADLVTLHVYSPPLTHMNVYSLDDASITRLPDPVNQEFFSGAGI